MSAVIHELHKAARGIVARPAFSALVVGVLACGLACVIFMLTVLDGLILHPLPFPQPDQLLQLGVRSETSSEGMNYLRNVDLVQIRGRLSKVADVAGIDNQTINLSDLGRPERYDGTFVSANAFHVLGVHPILGRDFASTDENDGAAPAALLSYALWHSRYGTDPAIVGKQIRVNARPTTVIGVMPPNFSFPSRSAIWLSTPLFDGVKRGEPLFLVVARRQAGVGNAAVRTAFDAWFADAINAEPAHFRDQHADMQPLASMISNHNLRVSTYMMLAAVVMVLLVACANVANLLLTRALARRQQFAVCVALGASRRRLILQFLAESVLLSLIAAIIALGLAELGVGWLRTVLQQSDSAPTWLHFHIGGVVLAFSLGAAAFTAVCCGTLPALRVGAMAASSNLRAGVRGTAGGSALRASGILVIVEVALSCALLVGVGTLVRQIVSMNHADLGIDQGHLLTARVVLPTTSYPTDQDRLHLYKQLVDRLHADPDVVDATIGSAFPGGGLTPDRAIVPVGADMGSGSLPRANTGAVDDRFLATYGISLQQGRFFDSRDRAASEHVAVVDRTFVDRFGHGRDVLGQQFRLDPRDPDATTVTVIGVIGALRMDPADMPATPTVLVPLRQQPTRVATIAVRTRGTPDAFAPRLQKIMQAVDHDTPLYWVKTYPKVIASTTFGDRLMTQLFGIFGIVALILAGAGLYGVMAFSVGQRTREIGVRRALGAPSGSVLRSLLLRSFASLGIGLAIGLAAGIPFARLLTAAMPDSGAVDGASLLVAVGVLIFAAALAVIVPAHRALRVDPMVALRYE